MRKVCDLCVRISTIPSEESVWSCFCVAFVLGYPLYQVRKVCDLCVRISTIPSEESVWSCLCVRISTIPSEESVLPLC